MTTSEMFSWRTKDSIYIFCPLGLSMKKVHLLGSVLTISLFTCIANATDFHTSIAAPTTSTPKQNKKLPVKSKDGTTCNATTKSSGGISLCAFLKGADSRTTILFSVANDMPVTATRFLQITN